MREINWLKSGPIHFISMKLIGSRSSDYENKLRDDVWALRPTLIFWYYYILKGVKLIWQI